MARILVVEDDNIINDMLHELLRPLHTVTQVFSGTEALRLFASESFDLIVLDLMLPGISGESLITKIRTQSQIPIIVITAKNDVSVLVDVLELGANDYIAKPFETKEVIARVSALLRKHGASEMVTTNRVGRFEIRSDTYEISLDNQCMDLTRKEHDMLCLLLSHPNRVFTKSNLYETIWEEPYFGDDNTITVHISRLRTKIKAITGDNEMIETVWGIGFKMSIE
ncbi:response regulator transcription factor [Erysipelothrix sp. HDW6C]|uniref:response regulator transcription factor n=1 Tax=Erysipelothrix sp. HDW6C TaxID=2714930 RepID=UPI00140B722A|nr:response regulator transcription factor [Erysipelothrix sp. HDW6C]QIK70643.1 response regulator transcription factor [Erysipelothrix sp. HDW6C]